MAYTTIDDPSAHFQVALHSSANAATITNDGNSDLQPDLIWSKARGAAHNHAMFSSSIGTVRDWIIPNGQAGEQQSATGYDLVSFDTNGFTTGNNQFNVICGGTTYVAWQWKANGGSTTSVSASGTGSGCVNACTYQANTTAGFSIITYTGRDDQLNNGQHSLLKHGLGVAPAFIILKRRDATTDWYVMGKEVTSASAYSNNEYLSLNDADGINGNSYTGSVAPTSTDIYLGNELVNVASALYLMYAFAEVQGYSKFSSYIGNGVANNGPFVYLGFKPRFIMIKSTTATGSHVIWDSKRSPFNGMDDYLVAAEADAEGTNGIFTIDAVSNGFKIRNTGANNGLNQSGTKYVYYAFAENPFTTSTGVPATAR